MLQKPHFLFEPQAGQELISFYVLLAETERDMRSHVPYVPESYISLSFL